MTVPKATIETYLRSWTGYTSTLAYYHYDSENLYGLWNTLELQQPGGLESVNNRYDFKF